MTTPRLNIPFVMPSQAQKHVTVNTAFAKIDALVQLSAKSRSQITPPFSVEQGDTYIVAAGAIGAWEGQDGAIAVYDDGAWDFVFPDEGWVCFVADEDQLYRYFGGWDTVPLANTTDRLGVNGTPDNYNKLLVQSEGVLFNHVGGHQRTTMNKNSATDDASHNFQTGFSSRALAGLLGSDDYTIKVSSDGSAFHTGLCLGQSTGCVSLGSEVDHLASVTIHDANTPELRMVTEAEDDITIGFYDAQSAATENCKIQWSAVSNGLSITTNNTPAFQIAANGTVSMPQVPVLSYSRDADLSWGGSTTEKIAFLTSRILQGNISMNLAKDKVTTDEAGTYLVSIRLMTLSGATGSNDAWSVELRQNGTNIIPNDTNSFCPNASSTTGVVMTKALTFPVVAMAADTFEIWVSSINSNATLSGAAVEFTKIA